MLFQCCIFFVKQKTAYEMRISDWSSDVCSSDLCHRLLDGCKEGINLLLPHHLFGGLDDSFLPSAIRLFLTLFARVGGECRNRVLHPTARVSRSEEHTSELPSLMRISYAVF